LIKSKEEVKKVISYVLCIKGAKYDTKIQKFATDLQNNSKYINTDTLSWLYLKLKMCHSERSEESNYKYVEIFLPVDFETFKITKTLDF